MGVEEVVIIIGEVEVSACEAPGPLLVTRFPDVVLVMGSAGPASDPVADAVELGAPPPARAEFSEYIDDTDCLLFSTSAGIFSAGSGSFSCF